MPDAPVSALDEHDKGIWASKKNGSWGRRHLRGGLQDTLILGRGLNSAAHNIDMVRACVWCNRDRSFNATTHCIYKRSVISAALIDCVPCLEYFKGCSLTSNRALLLWRIDIA